VIEKPVTVAEVNLLIDPVHEQKIQGRGGAGAAYNAVCGRPPPPRQPARVMMRTVVSLFRSGHPLPPTSAHTPSLSRQVLRAFWVMVTITGTAALLAAVLMEFLGRSSRAEF